MNCPECGKRIWSDDRYCKACGLNLGAAPPRAATIPVAEDLELKGVGGWLLFFCILRTALAPILFITLSLRFRPGLIDLLVLVEIVIGVVAGIHVWSLSKSAFLSLTIYFSASLLVTILRLFISLIALLAGESQSQIEAGVSLVSCFFGIALTIAWMGYFRYSDRVKATFGSNSTFFL